MLSIEYVLQSRLLHCTLFNLSGISLLIFYNFQKGFESWGLRCTCKRSKAFFVKILPIMWGGFGGMNYLVIYLHISDEEYIS